MHFVQRDDSDTPSLDDFCQFAMKHISNALGDTNSLGTPNNHKVRNYAFMKKFYATFNDHAEYVETLKVDADENSDSETVGDILVSRIGSLIAAAEVEPDPDYTGNIVFRDEEGSEDGEEE